jgi:TetR/AcrR family transcriptional regulator, transcriptional repressor for nem operon
MPRQAVEVPKKVRYSAKETAAKHEQIVKEASRFFRERGFENVTVAEAMKAAGLTHGAFYAHFDSKVELQKAAVTYGQELSADRARRSGATEKGRRAYAERYLSMRHRDNSGDGCTMAALGQELARSSPEIRTAFEQGLEEILSAHGGDREEGLFRTAGVLGAIVLARAVQNPHFANEILESVRHKLT